MQRIPDVLEDQFSIGQHRVVPVPAHSQPVLFEKTRPSSIPLIGFGMLAAIELDNEFRFAAVKIDDVWRDRMLAPELVPGEAPVPQQ